MYVNTGIVPREPKTQQHTSAALDFLFTLGRIKLKALEGLMRYTLGRLSVRFRELDRPTKGQPEAFRGYFVLAA